MRREWVALALLVFPLLEGTALAEESPSRETAPATSVAPPTADNTVDGADDTRKTSFAEQPVRPMTREELTRPVRKLDLPSRVGPILVIVGGGVTTSYASAWLLFGAAGTSMCEGTNCTSPDLTGFVVAGALGLAAVTVGVVWLVDVNNRRHALERSARTAASRRMLLPVYEPVTRTAGLTFAQQF